VRVPADINDTDEIDKLFRARSNRDHRSFDDLAERVAPKVAIQVID
jgi:hypothetical protein